MEYKLTSSDAAVVSEALDDIFCYSKDMFYDGEKLTIKTHEEFGVAIGKNKNGYSIHVEGYYFSNSFEVGFAENMREIIIFVRVLCGIKNKKFNILGLKPLMDRFSGGRGSVFYTMAGTEISLTALFENGTRVTVTTDEINGYELRYKYSKESGKPWHREQLARYNDVAKAIYELAEDK